VKLLGGPGCPSDLKTDLELRLQTPEHRSIKMMGSLRAVWPDRLRIQTRIGAFWPVASVAVRADSAFVSFPRLKAYWAGTFPGGSETDPASLASTLLWLLCPASIARELDEPVLEREEGGWVVTGLVRGSEPPLWMELRMGKKRAEVSEIRMLDSNGEERMVATRSGRIGLDDFLLPGKVRISSEEPPVVLEVRLLRPRPDPDQPEGIYRIPRPPGTTWIPQDQLLEMFGAAGEGP
jgi:hypothetical protein